MSLVAISRRVARRLIVALVLLVPLPVLGEREATAESALDRVGADMHRHGCAAGVGPPALCRALQDRARALAAGQGRPPRRGLFERLFAPRTPQPWPPEDPPGAAPGETDEYGFPRPAAATYRTLCVRLCDGYYWPISDAVPRSRFAADAWRCESSCASPARLFVHANPGGDTERMVDLAGQPYSALPAAFRYRQRYDPQCRCRPDPWSPEAQAKYAARTQSGAVAETTASPPLAVTPPDAAGSGPRAVADDAGGGLSRTWSGPPRGPARFDTHDWWRPRSSAPPAARRGVRRPDAPWAWTN